MKQIAICGIDTGIGKSVVTGLLARYLLEQKHSVMTWKPVQTGCTGKSEDILLHRKLMGTGWQEIDEAGHTYPYCFPFPGSPQLAARLAGEKIDPARLRLARQKLEEFDYLLMEGAGGLLVPLTEEMTLLDYLVQEQYSILLVTSPRLGSINHTLLSLEVLQQRNINLLGLVYNLYGDNPPEIVRDSLQVFKTALGRYNFPEKILLLPDSRESSAVNWSILL